MRRELPLKSDRVRRTWWLGSVVTLGSLVMLLASTQGSRTTESGDAVVRRGRYLVEFGGCSDCHTPMKAGPSGPVPDLSRYLAGHPADAKLPPPPELPPGPWFAVTAGLTAWSGPWGISYAANLTPDDNTGLGIWSEDTFIHAMRTGKHFGVSRDILPPMPWRSLAALSDADLQAVYAYLRSLPPIHNRVPEPVPPTGAPGYE